MSVHRTGKEEAKVKRDVEGPTKRNAEIHRLRMEEHWTLQDIADLYDLTNIS